MCACQRFVTACSVLHGFIEGYSSIALCAKMNTRGNVNGSVKLAITKQ